MPFGQVIIGPPGSGKSTYCAGMSQFLTALKRPCSVINLDPANDNLSYPCALDIRDLVSLEDVMEDEQLGPNGGVLHALDTLVENWEWFEGRVGKLKDDYILIDCPGQAEVFTHHHSLWNILHRLEQKLGYRLVALHLVDSQVLTRPSLYISSLLLGIRTQLHLGLPHLNVFTKIDLLSTYEPLPLPLYFYTEASPLSPILPFLSSDFASSSTQKPTTEGEDEKRHKSPQLSAKFERLNEAIVDLVEEYPMGYETLAVEDKKSMAWLLRQVDRAGGYAYGGAEGATEGVWETVAGERGEVMDVRDVEERWITHRAVYDEWEERQKKAVEEERKKAEGGEGLSVKENWKDEGMDEDELADLLAMREKTHGVKVMRVPKKAA